MPVNALANVVAGGQVSLTSTGDFGSTASGGNVVLGLPTVDPHVAGALWANSGVVTVSAG